MPKVGKKQFAYTSAGKKAAKAYAKKVGKKVGKYQVGGSVDPFSLKNPKGVIAKEAINLINEMNMEEQDMQDATPTTNAMDRSQAVPVGDEVGTGVYKEGGKVDVTDVVKSVEKAMSFQSQEEKFPDITAFTKKKKRHKRKAKKDAREIIEASRWGKDRPAGGWGKEKKK